MKQSFFGAIVAATFSCFSYASERDALALLYDALSGDQWNNADGWLSEAPLHEWHGIVTRDGHVIKIELPGNNLAGQLPDGLEDLGELEVLDLRWNNLWGSIPESFGEIGSLQSLLLTGNELSGEIPWSIGSIQTLKRLDLSNNQLWGEIPETLGDLRSLESLGLQHNQLTGPIPQTLTQIGTLRRVILNNNNLTGTVPSGFGQLPSGMHVQIGNNQLGFNSFSEMDSRSLDERDLFTVEQITGQDLLGDTTLVLGDNQAAEFVRTLMSALFVEDGYLNFEPAKLPQGVTAEQVRRVLDSVNHGLRESGDRIYSVGDLERVLELYSGGETIAIPGVESDTSFSFEAATPISSIGNQFKSGFGNGADGGSVVKQPSSAADSGGSSTAPVERPWVRCREAATKANNPHKSTTNSRQITGKAEAECEYMQGPPQSLTYTAIVRVQKREYFWGIIPYWHTVGRTERQRTADPLRFHQNELVAVVDFCINGIYRTLFSLHLVGSVTGTNWVPSNTAYYQRIAGVNNC